MLRVFAFLILFVFISVVVARRTSYSCSQSTGKNEPILSLLITSSVSSTVTCPKYYEKIDFNLNEDSGGKYIYACIIRGNSTERFGVPLSNLIATTGTTNANICPPGFTRIMQDLNAGAGGNYVYFCSERFGSEAITDISFVANSDSCPAGYSKSSVDLNAGTKSATSVYLCLETDCKLSLNIPTSLQFQPESKELKITQFTDSHYGEGYDQDLLSAASIYRTVLQTEDPDVVALTGDQVSGYSWDGTNGWFEQVVARVLDTILSLGYPFFYLNGNHDPQADLTQREIVNVINRLGGALSLTILSPVNVTGGTNYWLPVYSYADESKLAYSLWVLDSNGDDCEGISGWGCIARDQVEWYIEAAASVKAKNGGSLPPALGYFHIPIDEYLKVSSASKTECQGIYDEDVCCSAVNTGVFNAIKQVGDISATFVGHDHDNDFGFNYEDVYMYYGRKSGYGGYGPPLGMQRGSRVVVLQEGVRGVAQTWIRNEDGSRDDQANCKKTGSQSICCGASTPVTYPTESVVDSAVYQFVKTPVDDLSAFQRQFDAAYNVQKPNKCQLYEAAFRAGMNPEKDALEHAQLLQ